MKNLKNSGFSKIWIGVVIVVILIGGFFTWKYLMVPREIIVIDDKDLRSDFFIPSGEVNASFYIKQAVEALVIPPNIHPSIIFNEWMETDKYPQKNEIKEVINNNRQALYFLEKAIDACYFQFPKKEKIKKGEGIYPIVGWGGLADLMAIRILLEVKQGQDDIRAVKNALGLVRLGHIIQNSFGHSIGYIVGQHIKMTGLDTLYKMIIKDELSDNALRKISDSLPNFRDTRSGLSNAIKIEYMSTINTLNFIQKTPDLKLPEKVDIKVRKTLVEYYRNLVRGAETEFYINNFSSFPPVVVGENMCSVTLQAQEVIDTMLLIPDPSILFQKRHSEEFYVQSISLLAVLRKYYNNTGSLPENLDTLVPLYVEEIFRDPFDGQYIRYCKNRGIIYSVGKDFEYDKDKILKRPIFWRRLNLDNPILMIKINI